MPNNSVGGGAAPPEQWRLAAAAADLQVEAEAEAEAEANLEADRPVPSRQRLSQSR